VTTVPSRKSIALHLLLLIAAGTSWWAAERMFPEELAESREDLGTIDYYSKGVRRTAHDANGKMENLLVAVTMLHYKSDGRTELEQPVMTLTSTDGKPPWIIESETGVLEADGELILLNGKVRISKKNEKGEELKIFTRDVRYRPPEEYAETAERVRMVTPTDELTGTGMQTTFKPNLILKILSEVRRKHEAR